MPDGSTMKETADDIEVRDGVYRATAKDLRSFIERFEKITAEKDNLSECQKEIMAEAKGRGYDVKALRKIIAERKRGKDEVAEEQAVLDMYKTALGM